MQAQLPGRAVSPHPRYRVPLSSRAEGLGERYPAELVLVSVRPEILRLEHAAPDLEAMISRIRSEGLLLDPAHLAAVTRYEAHLRRQFIQYLHELQANQSQRGGLPAPLARLDVQLSAP